MSIRQCNLKAFQKQERVLNIFFNFKKILNVPNAHLTDIDTFAKSIISLLYLGSSRKMGTGEGEMTGRWK